MTIKVGKILQRHIANEMENNWVEHDRPFKYLHISRELLRIITNSAVIKPYETDYGTLEIVIVSNKKSAEITLSSRRK